MLKILWKMGEIAPQEQFLPLSTIFCYLILDFYVKSGIRFFLRNKRLFEITEVDITRVDCIYILSFKLCEWLTADHSPVYCVTQKSTVYNAFAQTYFNTCLKVRFRMMCINDVRWRYKKKNDEKLRKKREKKKSNPKVLK